ncbi:hypothetical protein FSP39_003958 [Pinctada imbricata]|uniref:F-box only protein 47 n=1 Tax=Pinctada imbricata TaxID=66713 RepID=A0AA88YGW4_PINIB|nr:hypothetical protein FSP39_003958 [Pinctada imbricata]
MDIKAFLPCKKPRRSNRLEVKEKHCAKTEEIKQGQLGYFSILPLELKFCILKYLRVEDLSILTITSKAMRNLIEGYRVLMPALQKDLVHRVHSQNKKQPLPLEKQSELIKRFHKLGLLMKRSTCLYSTKDRLRYVNDVLSKMMCSNASHCDNVAHCVSMTCFGRFLHTVIAGWDDCECQRTYESITSHICIMRNVKLVVNSKPGIHSKAESEIRTFFRRVFLDNCQSMQDKAFWLTQILKPWPMVQQARLIFLLYGPEVDEEVLWYELCENTPFNAEQSAKHFGDLANALQILNWYQQEWSSDDIVSILDELTSSPEEWLAENVAHLLILCGDTITTKMLASKAINGRIIELSGITTSFCVVCVKNSFSLSYVLVMIQHIVQAMDNSKDRLQFFNSVMDMFKELILDLHEFVDPEDGHENDMYYMVTALSEFTKKLIQMAFKATLSV